MKELRTAGAEALVVDGGNLFFYRRLLREAESQQLLFKARVIVEAYNAIGVAAVALGPFDFAAGYDRLRALERAADFPFLCANLLDRATGEPLFRPYAIAEVAGRRVGLLGVLDSTAAVDGLEPMKNAVRVDSLYTTVRRYAQELRKQGCDLVVVLSSADPKKFRLLGKSIPEVDLYLVGDPDDSLRIPWRVGSSLVANATQLGKYLAHLRVAWQGGAGGGPGIRNRFEPLRPEDPDEPQVRRLVDSYYAYAAVVRVQEPERYVKEEEQRVNLQQGRPVFVSAGRCRECHPRQAEHWAGTPHAHAWTALSPEGRDRDECLECHVTGYGVDGGFEVGGDPDLTAVQCEACHGAGSLHPALAVGRTGKAVGQVCRGCHTRSRSPDFDPAAVWAAVVCPREPTAGKASPAPSPR